MVVSSAEGVIYQSFLKSAAVIIDKEVSELYSSMNLRSMHIFIDTGLKKVDSL